MRDSFLRRLVWFGAIVALLTEFLSLFHLLRRGPLIAAWLIVAAATLRPRIPRPSFKPFELAILLMILAILVPVGITAFLSPPNSADAMAYHMPRVIYWAQAGSVAFFPTPYFNQVMLSPLNEYLMLHTYVLTGGDRLINLLTFAAFVLSIVAVSALAGVLGLGRRGQAMAAIFCATLPNGILQASGAKNDWLLTLWLLLMTYFAFRRDAPLTGLALGLAVATKATAWLFAPPLLAVSMIWRSQCAAAFLAGGILLINTPQFVRNLRLSGSPLGFDSAQGDGIFRWRNEHPGWRSTVSNALRNASEQLGARSERWNRTVFINIVRIHRLIGLDPDDPDTTWHGNRYEAPRNSNHEASANNRWHLLWISLAAIAAVRHRRWRLYAAALAAAFLLFCFYLKWQPFQARLELPLFVLAAPLAARLLDSLRPAALAPVICLFLLTGARLPAIENWTRPLRGPASLWRTSRDENYFSDMSQWHNKAFYLEAVDRVAAGGCSSVAIDISENQLEYPFQALLRERNPAARFSHPGMDAHPCALLCLDCAGKQPKLDLYRGMGPPVTIGSFVLFQFRK